MFEKFFLLQAQPSKLISGGISSLLNIDCGIKSPRRRDRKPLEVCTEISASATDKKRSLGHNGAKRNPESTRNHIKKANFVCFKPGKVSEYENEWKIKQ